MLSDEFKLAPPGQGGEGGAGAVRIRPEDPQNNSTKDGEGSYPIRGRHPNGDAVAGTLAPALTAPGGSCFARPS
jgi:hypothetical protein